MGWQRKTFKDRAKRVRLLLLDVDGVLTDGRLGFEGAGRETKFFHIRDGQGIKLLKDGGIRVGILTGRRSEAVELRARELGIDPVHQRVKDKARALPAILKKEKVQASEVCYVGDDLADLGILARVGMAVAVADAAAEVKAMAHYLTRLPGGQGAVREVCEEILKAQGKWEEAIQRYLPPSTGHKSIS